jgi:hypothetical protein
MPATAIGRQGIVVGASSGATRPCCGAATGASPLDPRRPRFVLAGSLAGFLVVTTVVIALMVLAGAVCLLWAAVWFAGCGHTRRRMLSRRRRGGGRPAFNYIWGLGVASPRIYGAAALGPPSLADSDRFTGVRSRARSA